jgi:hypothetical protein
MLRNFGKAAWAGLRYVAVIAGYGLILWALNVAVKVLRGALAKRGRTR